MKTYDTLEEFLQHLEGQMISREENKEYSLSVHALLRQGLDDCIRSGDYGSVESLLPYFEPSSATPKCYHSGETKRIYTLIMIVMLELKGNEELFLSSVSGYQELVEQYTLTLFSMRRLELALSEASMQEASAYLQSIPLSIHAARLISENEYFENYQRLYWNLYSCMRGRWSVVSRVLWLTHMLQTAESARVLLELSSLYLEMGEYRKAYQYLQRIPSPSPETVTLISSLKELLPDE